MTTPLAWPVVFGIVTGFWTLIALIGPFLVPKANPSASIYRCCIVMIAVCCWLHWCLCFLSQVNPLAGPIMKRESVNIVRWSWEGVENWTTNIYTHFNIYCDNKIRTIKCFKNCSLCDNSSIILSNTHIHTQHDTLTSKCAFNFCVYFHTRILCFHINTRICTSFV